jgi:predicted nuclease of predicted toxin-antitoxin system
MPPAFYADVNIPTALVNALTQLGCDVLRVQDDQRRRHADESLLERACSLQRILVTLDSDFVVIGHRWQAIRRAFPGIIWITSDKPGPRLLSEDTLLLLEVLPENEIRDQVHCVPLGQRT